MAKDKTTTFDRHAEAAAVMTLVMERRIAELRKEIAACEGLLERFAAKLPSNLALPETSMH